MSETLRDRSKITTWLGCCFFYRTPGESEVPGGFENQLSEIHEFLSRTFDRGTSQNLQLVGLEVVDQQTFVFHFI